MFNKESLKKHLINIRGYKFKQKFLVFESDDWGAIRIPNMEARDVLWEKGYTKKTDPFARFDTLESADDYTALFDVLSQYKDNQDNKPVLTANFIMNNPNFEAIKQSDFKQYHSESFLESYQRYPNSREAWQVLQQGIHQKLIQPQFHGAEHLNVMRWMDLLQQKNISFKEAFDLQCYAIDDLRNDNRRSNLMAAYDFDSKEELIYIQKSINEGLQQFQDIFGFSSQTSIAPCYVWNDDVEKEMKKNNVNCFQGSYQQNIPEINKSFQKKYRYTGQQNNWKQTYLVRNGLFEPSLNNQIDWIQKCLESIAIAFQWGKPAIIGSHRINFAGRLDVHQRDQNLTALDILLQKILQKWPDVQFVDSAELYKKMITK
jgi:hypothetical protein